MPGESFQSLIKSYLKAANCCFGEPAGSETTITVAPQGLTKTDLVVSLGHVLALPVYQLTLPFTHEAWRQLE